MSCLGCIDPVNHPHAFDCSGERDAPTVTAFTLTKTSRAAGAATYHVSTHGGVGGALAALRADHPRKRKVFALYSDGIARPYQVR